MCLKILTPKNGNLLFHMDPNSNLYLRNSGLFSMKNLNTRTIKGIVGVMVLIRKMAKSNMRQKVSLVLYYITQKPFLSL